MGTHLAAPVPGFSTQRCPSPQYAHLHPHGGGGVGAESQNSGQGGRKQGATLQTPGGGQWEGQGGW